MILLKYTVNLMINIVYRLVSPKLFEEVYGEIDDLENEVIVRPTHLSICRADQRYYQGNRIPEILKYKLPMAFTHEGVGEVIKDNTGNFAVGDKVVMIANIPFEYDEFISENYLKSSKFRSSGYDGFMEDYVSLKPDRLVKIPDNSNLYVFSFTELVTVSYQAIMRFKKFSNKNKDIIGVWGDGNLGYITSLILKVLFPDSKVFVFGVHDEKLEMFSFVDETYKINEVPKGIVVNHAFEAVGGLGSQDAIEQIIDIIKPEGTISILGVSEGSIQINTRKILEKGLVMFGTNRSGRNDFLGTINLFNTYPKVLEYLENIIGEIIEINNLEDINMAFDKDFNSSFGKTILIWNK